MFYTCLYIVNKCINDAYVDLYGYFNHSKMREREEKKRIKMPEFL